MAFLRGGMSAWIQALLARPQPSGPAITDPPTPPTLAPAKCDWVFALTALVLGQADQQEARHA